MRVPRPLTLVLAAALLLPATLALEPLNENDAGSARDAGHTSTTAVAIQPEVVYSGEIRTPDLEDWYSFTARAGDRLAARFFETNVGCVDVRNAAGYVVREATYCPLLPTSEAVVRWVVPADGTYHLAFFALTPGSYRFAFGLDGDAPLPPGPIDLSANDAGSGKDAPVDFGSALPLAPGIAYEGHLSAIATTAIADWIDVYRFQAPGPAALRLRLAVEANACLTVRDANDVGLADTCGVSPLSEGELTVALPVAGEYYFDILDFAPQRYQLSFTLDGSAPAPLDLSSSLLDPTAPTRPEHPARPPGADVVLALIDDGINPYHETFRDASTRAQQHPSTYLVGYPADAEPLHLTFGHATLADAVRADCAEWAKVREGRLYYIPGTRIVGAHVEMASTWPDGVQRVQQRPITCASPAPTGNGDIVGTGGHGTMVASRAAANGYGACPECLIVIAQGFNEHSVKWASEQPWIDIQSNSWGPLAPGYAPAGGGRVFTTPTVARLIEEGAQRQMSFWGSGNGVLFRYGVVGHPTQLAPHLGPSAWRVGGHDSGYVAAWPGSSPHVVSDACNSWAAEHEYNGVSTPETGGGTSAASPYAAGIAAALLREARLVLGDARTGERAGGILASGTPTGTGALSDGALTRDELMDALLATANARPTGTPEDAAPCFDVVYGATPLKWSSVPAGPAGVPLVGYGALTRATSAAALDVLKGVAIAPVRASEDAYFAADKSARGVLYAAYTAPP